MWFGRRSVIGVGTCLTVFGFLVYYLLPLALLSMNLQLFITIFFWILIGTFIGLVMMALNVEIIVEVSAAYSAVTHWSMLRA